MKLRHGALQGLDCVAHRRYGLASDQQVHAAQKAVYYARVNHDHLDLIARDPKDPIARRLGAGLKLDSEAEMPKPTPRRRERVEEVLPGTNAVYLHLFWKILLANTTLADCIRAQRSLLGACPEFFLTCAFLEGRGEASEPVLVGLSGFNPIAICAAEIRYALHLEECLHAFRFARLVIQQLCYLALSSRVREAVEPFAETVQRTVLQRVDDGRHVIGSDASVLVRELDVLRRKSAEVNRISGAGLPWQPRLRGGLYMELFASHIRGLADPEGGEPSGLFRTHSPPSKSATIGWEKSPATPSVVGRLPTAPRSGD